MPIYVYSCEKCSHRATEHRAISERDSELKCPVCGGEMKRRVAKNSFALAGTGWFKDGYK